MENEELKKTSAGPIAEEKKKTNWGKVMAPTLIAVGILIGYFGRPLVDAASVVSGGQSAPITQMLLSQTRHWKGNANAPVTMIEFSDFQCPFCGRFASDAGRQIDEQFVKTGVVRFGYHHYAFLGAESGWAAEASECADEQGAFWAYHDKVFASQAGENKGAFAKDRLKQFAAALGLNATAFNACLDSGKYTAQIKTDAATATSIGVDTTPMFLINGTPVKGAVPFEVFRQAIEAAKAK